MYLYEKWLYPRDKGIVAEEIEIHLLPTAGIGGQEWIARLEPQRVRVFSWAREHLCSPAFKPTKGLVRKVVIVPKPLIAEQLGMAEHPVQTGDLRRFATIRGLKCFDDPEMNVEVSCQLAEQFCCINKLIPRCPLINRLGLTWIVPLHKPVVDKWGDEYFLAAANSVGGGALGMGLNAHYNRPGFVWPDEIAFAFVAEVIKV